MKIECNECNEVIETTATTVVSPYVCDDCRTAVIFQDMITPRAETIDEAVTRGYNMCLKAHDIRSEPQRGNGLGEASVRNGLEEASIAPPTDSTEATTQIIVDLEEQIAQGSELIADMKSQLDEKNEDIDFLLASNIDQQIAFWRLRNLRDRLAKEVVNLADDLAEAKRMNQKNLFYRNRYFEQTQELLGRGFWARVFNKQ